MGGLQLEKSSNIARNIISFSFCWHRLLNVTWVKMPRAVCLHHCGRHYALFERFPGHQYRVEVAVALDEKAVPVPTGAPHGRPVLNVTVAKGMVECGDLRAVALGHYLARRLVVALPCLKQGPYAWGLLVASHC